MQTHQGVDRTKIDVENHVKELTKIIGFAIEAYCVQNTHAFYFMHHSCFESRIAFESVRSLHPSNHHVTRRSGFAPVLKGLNKLSLYTTVTNKRSHVWKYLISDN